MLSILLGQPPNFSEEVFSPEKNKLVWQKTTDFTNGQASSVAEHKVEFELPLLESNFLVCDARLAKIVQDCPPWKVEFDTSLMGGSYAKGGYDSPVIANPEGIFDKLEKIEGMRDFAHFRECYVCHRLINQNTNTHWICEPKLDETPEDFGHMVYTFTEDKIYKNGELIDPYKEVQKFSKTESATQTSTSTSQPPVSQSIQSSALKTRKRKPTRSEPKRITKIQANYLRRIFNECTFTPTGRELTPIIEKVGLSAVRIEKFWNQLRYQPIRKKRRTDTTNATTTSSDPHSVHA